MQQRVSMRVRWRAMADRRGATRTHHASALDRDAHGDSPALPSPAAGTASVHPVARRNARADPAGAGLTPRDTLGSVGRGVAVDNCAPRLVPDTTERDDAGR